MLGTVDEVGGTAGGLGTAVVGLLAEVREQTGQLNELKEKLGSLEEVLSGREAAGSSGLAVVLSAVTGSVQNQSELIKQLGAKIENLEGRSGGASKVDTEEADLGGAVARRGESGTTSSMDAAQGDYTAGGSRQVCSYRTCITRANVDLLCPPSSPLNQDRSAHHNVTFGILLYHSKLV